MKRWLDVLIPGFLLLCAVFLSTQQAPIVDRIRHGVFDSYQRQAPRPYTDLPVRIVDIDEESLKRFGQWPWPRSLVAELVDKLAAAGAAVVAFDIVFAEPDRLAPSNLMLVWRDRPELADMLDQLRRLPDPDQVLAESLSRIPAATTFVLTEQSGGRAPAVKWGEGSEAGADPRLFVRTFAGAIATLPEIEAAAQGNGSANFAPDADTIVRRVPLLSLMGRQLYPSLAAEAVRLAHGAPSYDIKSSGGSGEWGFGEQTGIVAVRIGEPIVKTDGEGALYLYDSDHQPARFVPAWRILDGGFDKAAIEGRIVLLGTSAEALKDAKATPLNPVMAGVEIQAQVIEQILSGSFLLRPDWAPGAELIYLTLFGVALIFTIRRVGALWALLFALAAGGGAIWFSWYGFRGHGWLIDPIYPCLVALAIYLSGSLISYLRTEGEKRFMRLAFGRYLPPTVVQELVQHHERLTLGGEMRDLTLLFSDIRGFTRIAEQLAPDELTRLINRFLTPLTRAIHARGGTIDKYMGDCIMAFWNAPVDVADHAARSVRAALTMQVELRRLNGELVGEAKRDRRPPIQLRAGIGLNSGRCCVGNMGSDQRFDYSVIGDTVNIASRFEGLSRAYGVDIVIGEDTRRQAPSLAYLELDLVRVKGRESPLRIFTALGEEDVAGSPSFIVLARHHDRLIAAYRAQAWAAARAALSDCRAVEPALGELYDVYDRRIADYVAAPPPANWDGVHGATTKRG
ncbi:MAG: CHASE2 domain-containing protein [Dongiaceae bacterium]